MPEFDAQAAFHKDHKDVAICRLKGAIDTSTILKFQTALYRLRRQGIRQLVMDMEEISYVNSTGFSVILKHAQILKNGAGELVLAHMHPKVHMVYEVLGLTSFLRVFENAEEAAEAISESAEGAETVPSNPEQDSNA